MTQINLKPYAGAHSIVMSGRPRATQIRKELNLDDLDKKDESVEVLVPLEVVSLNSSFFLGLFGQSVRNLGVEKFFQKYRFNGSPTVLVDVERGARDALETSNPLR